MRLAAQLYTVREYTKTPEGFDDVLGMMHGIGYEGVQISAVGALDSELDAAGAREMLDSHGLVCCATHRPWTRLHDHTQEEIEFHRTLGCDYVAVGGVFDEAYVEWVGQAVPVAAELARAGIRLGYHNHAHEFARREEGGTWFEFLVREGGEQLMMEVDTYWVNHAGADPAGVLRSLAGRVPVIHVKDKEVVPREGPTFAPVGEGNLDWAAILDACAQSGVEWLVVEQDTCRRDPFDCLRSSFDYLDAALRR